MNCNRTFSEMVLEETLLTLDTAASQKTFNKIFDWVGKTSELPGDELKAAALMGVMVGIRLERDAALGSPKRAAGKRTRRG